MSGDAESQSAAGTTSDPYYAANFNKWAARAYWTPAEIAALSIGKHPWSLNEETCLEHPDSWFSIEFLERLDVFRRAAETQQIDWRCPPNKAIELMERLAIPFVPGLKEEVSRFHPVVDWECAFNEVLAWARESQAELKAQLNEYQQALEDAKKDSGEFEAWREKAQGFIRHLVEENKRVSEELERLQATSEESPPGAPFAANDNEDEALPPKERHSKDMMLAAMAIFGYGFDPAAKKSVIPGDVCKDIAEIGYTLTPEVAGRHIRAACKRLGITELPDHLKK